MFEPSFFKTNFWAMWCTTFAFQTWHSAVELKRYLNRFVQEFPRIHSLAGVRRTPYNQYDSIVRPLVRWLKEAGVRFLTGACVADLGFVDGPKGKTVETIHYSREGADHQLELRGEDLAFVTIGSMTAASSLGSMHTAPALNADKPGGSWALWRTLAARTESFGHPDVFTRDVDKSKWLSFTVTLRDPEFMEWPAPQTCR